MTERIQESNFQNWLGDKPRDWILPLATRAALRVLPFALPLRGHTKVTSRLWERDLSPVSTRLALVTIRANLIAWTACLSEQHAQELEFVAGSFAKSAIEAGDLYTAGYAARAAANAVAYLAERKPHFAYLAANVSASVAAAFGSDADAWGAIDADANWLQKNKLTRSLATQPLWLNEVRGGRTEFKVNLPIWARTPLDNFGETDWVTNGPWGVWVTWYRELLVGRARLFNIKNAFEIASTSESFWRPSPHRVTASVAALVRWKWNESNWIWPEEDETPSAEQTSDGQEPPPGPPEPAAPRPLESVSPKSDEPTDNDRLNRRPFAQALVERLDEVFKEGAPDGFAIHIHAPWGAGKTSVLKMMRKLMTATDRTSKNGEVAPQWVVVEFNAWKNERRNPPWWPLIEETKSECLRSLSSKSIGLIRLFKASGARFWEIGDSPKAEDKAAVLELRWLWWKIRTDLVPYLIAAVVAVFCFWLLWSLRGSTGDKLPVFFDAILKLLTAATTAYIAFLGASRIAFFGSADAAKLYEETSRDPLERITGIFKSIINTVKESGKPVCIFIDDLDRCSADYVVDLLEGIQTSFRHPHVAYVVAADRAWIRASFEARYGKFFETVGSAGQPLGYLFLEKLFQVSTPLPGMGSQTRATYWDELLKGVGADTKGTEFANDLALSDTIVKDKRAALRREHRGNLTREQADEALKKSNTPEDRAAVVLELTASPEAAAEAQHMLSQFKDIVPDIPRVMKRMINAYALRQAIGLLENTDISTEIIARWTILEQRYPALADLLIEHPEWTTIVARELAANAKIDLPEPLKPFVNSREIMGIMAAGDQALTEARVRTLTRGSSS